MSDIFFCAFFLRIYLVTDISFCNFCRHFLWRTFLFVFLKTYSLTDISFCVFFADLYCGGHLFLCFFADISCGEHFLYLADTTGLNRAFHKTGPDIEKALNSVLYTGNNTIGNCRA